MKKEELEIEEATNRLKEIMSYHSSYSIVYEIGTMLRNGDKKVSRRAEEKLTQFLDEDIEDKFLAFCWLYEELLKKGDLEEKTIRKMKKFEVDPINSLIARDAKKAVETKEKILKRIFN